MDAELNQVDLDGLVSEFNKWQQVLFDADREKVDALERMSLMNKLMEDTHSRENALKKECEQLRSSISTLQHCIMDNCDMQEDNRELRHQVRKLEDEMKAITKTHENSLAVKEVELSEMRAEHDVELADVEAVIKAQCSIDTASLQNIIDAKDEELKQKDKMMKEQEYRHQEQMTELERKSHTEMMRVRQEYDQKMLKLEKQAVRKQQSTSGAGLSQDIFRKKLQHAKNESDREIASLNSTISDLQRKLQEAHQPSTSSPGYPPIKRSRRF